MRKIRLDLDTLQVETFRPEEDGDAAQGGTVLGHTTHHCTCEPACVFSQTCTMDPGNVECYSYAEPCPETRYPNWTCDRTDIEPCYC